MTIEESHAIPQSERPTRPGYHNRRLTRNVPTGYALHMSDSLILQVFTWPVGGLAVKMCDSGLSVYMLTAVSFAASNNSGQCCSRTTVSIRKQYIELRNLLPASPRVVMLRA